MNRSIFPKQNGFTLVEIIVVVIIIGVLASLTFPNLSDMIEKARMQEGISAVDAYALSCKRFFIERDQWPTSGEIGLLDITISAPKYFGAAAVAGSCGGGECALISRSGTGPTAGLQIAKWYNGANDGQFYCNHGGNGLGFCPKLGSVNTTTGVLTLP